MRKKWLVVGLVIVAIGAEGTALWLDRNDDDTKTVAIATVAASTGQVSVDVAATGTIKAASSRSLSFTVDGTVATVAVRAGSVVKRGAVLAAVVKTDAAEAVDDAQDTLDAAEDQLDAAEAAAASKTTAAQTRSETTAETRTDVAAKAGPQAATGLDAILTAEQRVNQAEADLANAKIALVGATITAPIAGTVMSVAGAVGSQVSKGATFVTLADTYTMQVSASFPEADAGSLATGQNATVTLADRVGEQFPARVLQVDPVGTSDGTLVTYNALLSFTRQPSGLLAGQSAAVEVRTGLVNSTLRVPSTAVHDVRDGRGTVQVRRGQVTTARQVEVGVRGDQYTQIVSGLTEGEMVVRSW